MPAFLMRCFFSGVMNHPPGCSRTMYCSPSTNPRMVNRLLSALATVVIWENSHKARRGESIFIHETEKVRRPFPGVRRNCLGGTNPPKTNSPNPWHEAAGKIYHA